MTKYHISINGDPAPCHAQEGRCPRGGDDAHGDFKNKAEARQWAELELMKERLFNVPSSVGKRAKEVSVSSSDTLDNSRAYMEFVKRNESNNHEAVVASISRAEPVPTLSADLTPYASWGYSDPVREADAWEELESAIGFFDKSAAKMRHDLELEIATAYNRDTPVSDEERQYFVGEKQRIERKIARRQKFVSIMQQIGIGSFVRDLDWRFGDDVSTVENEQARERIPSVVTFREERFAAEKERQIKEAAEKAERDAEYERVRKAGAKRLRAGIKKLEAAEEARRAELKKQGYVDFTDMQEKPVEEWDLSKAIFDNYDQKMFAKRMVKAKNGSSESAKTKTDPNYVPLGKDNNPEAIRAKKEELKRKKEEAEEERRRRQEKEEEREERRLRRREEEESIREARAQMGRIGRKISESRGNFSGGRSSKSESKNTGSFTGGRF